MKRLFAALVILGTTLFCPAAAAPEDSIAPEAVLSALAADSLSSDSGVAAMLEALVGEEDMAALQAMNTEGMGLHEQLKTKFVEGSAGFMSLVALALVIGLALCIERIIYLTLAEVDTRKLLGDIEKKVEANDIEGAKTLCRNTRGPVASICYQGLMYAGHDLTTAEHSIMNYGAVQTGLLEKGCSWIKLMIAIAPSLGFLGTVIGMVMAFDQIQEAGDISPTIVAEGMKVALITTIFGIVVALVLQLFYNFILSRIDRLNSQMEEAAVTLLDIFARRK